MLMTAGCQTYRPAPIDTTQVAIARQQRSADADAIRREQARLAPDVPFDAIQWDRLALLAALLVHNPDIAAARAAIDTARAQARAARVAPGATLTLSSEYANDPSSSSPWLLSGALDVPLDIGGRRTARITGAALGIIIARYDYADTLWAARMKARQALTDMLAATREEAVAGQLLGYRTQQQAAMARRLGAGAIARADLERVRADVASAAAAVDDARSRRISARQALAAAIGLPETAIASRSFTWTGFDDAPADPTLSPQVRDRIGATVARADVLKAVAAYDRSESDLRGEVARQYPALSVGPGYTWERGLVKLPLAVGLALPPLDLNRHAIAAAQAARTEAGKKLETIVA
ncbi:MAG TPA: TolC family protein, partial [Sphingobium sp.]